MTIFSARSRRCVTTILLGIVIVVANGFALTQSAHARTPDFVNVPTVETPYTLVQDGVTDYALATPKLFWRTTPVCDPTVAAASDAAAEATAVANLTDEIISRIGTTGSQIRELFENIVSNVCGQQLLLLNSNLAADDDYVYWINRNGVQKLSTNANVGDPPELLSGAVTGFFGEVTEDANYVYASNFSELWQITKADGSAKQIGNAEARNLSADGKYLYWKEGTSLKRYRITGGLIATISTGAGAYYAEGRRTTVVGNALVISENVYIAKGKEIERYSNITNSVQNTVYTSSANMAGFDSIVTDRNHLFFIERRTAPCTNSDPQILCATDALIRSSRTSQAPETLYISETASAFAGPATRALSTDGTYLFWQEFGGIRRLPNDAAAFPVINIAATGMEVTQGIQDLSNSVLLVENRRTFVRVYVESSGASVAGVPAYLTGTSGRTQLGTLVPVNDVGKKLTVRTNPNRTDLNHSFLFELPWEWTELSNLVLRAEVNPYQAPPEPNYADNSTQIGPLTFLPSPRIETHIFAFGYELDGQLFYPRFKDDITQTFSWIRRVFPVDSSFGFHHDPSPGFRHNLNILFDDGLGSRVDQSHAECQKLLTKDADGNDVDNRNLCASAYTNALMNVMRTQLGISNNIFMYGMIFDPPEVGNPPVDYFPRGQACCGENVSTGPAGPGTWGWDVDGSYADWYAGHEIGHTLGRAHPSKNSDDPATMASEGCGHSRSDPGFPHDFASIGPDGGTMWGFDAGDPEFGIPRAVLPSATWRDLMSYCNFQWISDYTYEAMYNFAINNTVAAADASTVGSTVAPSGDYLVVAGVIASESSGILNHAGRYADVAEIPAFVPGDYSIRLLRMDGSTLADYAFTADSGSDSPLKNFAQVVDYVTGTSRIQLVHLPSGNLLDEKTVSDSAPEVNTIEVSGDDLGSEATLTWQATDADNDDLTVDILYSADGEIFEPLQFGIRGNSATIDTSRLPGSDTAIFRAIASDGVLRGEADSLPFAMPFKMPAPTIHAPVNNLTVQYGQLVNFVGSAESPDGPATLVWRNADGETLGSGSLLSVDDLDVGENIITLRASIGRRLAAVDVTVFVEDDLSIPAPLLSASPLFVGWTVELGDAPQSTEIEISNVGGGGSINWSAAVDADWVILSEAAATSPAMLTIIANTDGLGANESRKASLTLTMAATGNRGEQTLIIPLVMSNQGAWIPPANNDARNSGGSLVKDGNSIFLPLIALQ